MNSEKPPATQADTTTSCVSDPEKRKRIRLSALAYAYEIEDDPLASDEDFDRLAASIDPSIRTGNDKLDEFFRSQFSPHTGQWVRSHPELNKLRRLVATLRSSRSGQT